LHFSANVGVIKEEEASSGNVALPAQSRQTTCTTSGNTSNSSGVLESASVSASPATGKPLKIEEKLDIAVAVKSGKRQKRTRNMQDTAAFDKEEKKVCHLVCSLSHSVSVSCFHTVFV
jgi:hypothetical protein